MKFLTKVPKLTDIKLLRVREKGDWKGFNAKAVGLMIKIGLLFKVKAAKRFMEEFATTIGDTIYRPRNRGKISKSLLYHEGVHFWQEKNYKFYKTRYTLHRKSRLHFEAMAYAMQVAHFGTSLSDASKYLADPIYALKIEPSRARTVIWIYVQKFLAV